MAKTMTRRAFVVGAAVASGALIGGCAGEQGSPGAQTTGGAENGKSAPDSAASAGQTSSDAAVAASSANQPARPSTHGALSVKSGKLVDASGNPVQLKGFSTHGLAWFPQYVNEACFAELSAWGANVARLALYTHENGGYCTDGNQQQLRDLLVQGVQAAKAADMYCIVDWHVLQDLSPNVYLDQAKEFWKWAAAEFASASNVIFEICNEPNGGTTWADVKSYAESILPIIRAAAPTLPVLVGTPTWCQQPDLAAADPLSDQYVMYTLHFYAGTHKDDLRAKLRSVAQAGVPVFVSEYGICDASGNGALDLASAAQWVSLMDELGVSYVCWNLSNKAESSSFIATDCSKTSGFTDDDLTPCGAWLKGMLGGNLSAEVAKGGAGTDGADGASGQSSTLALNGIESGAGTAPAANLRQSWETDGKPYLLYDVSIASDQNASSWEATLTFSAPIALTDSWNCTATVDGQTLRLTPASYNANIAAGATISDIGFIICPG